MENFKEKILDGLPNTILLFFLCIFLLIVYRLNLHFDNYIELIKLTIWPVIVLVALLFFRKVFVYMFFSMDEFNFFGMKGGLKDIRKVIEEKVQERMLQEEDQKKRNNEIANFEQTLKDINASKETAEKKAEENALFSKQVFDKYIELSAQNDSTLNELNQLRKEKEDRRLRTLAMKARINERRSQQLGFFPEENQDEVNVQQIPKADKFRPAK